MDRRIASRTREQEQAVTPEGGGILQSRCACGNHTIAGDTCTQCSNRQLAVQHATIASAEIRIDNDEKSPSVHEALNSPCQQPDVATMSFDETAMGPDFTQASIYTGTREANKVGILNALTCTSGQTAVFRATKHVHEMNKGRSPFSVKQPTQLSKTISTPADVAEKEADRIADKLIEEPVLPHPQQRSHNPVHRRQAPQLSLTSFNRGLESQLNVVRSSVGKPLPQHVRQFFEQKMGYDFSMVRVHNDAKAHEAADAINARAYTIGNHIGFANREYSPDIKEGKRLLGHELVHVAQGARRVYRKKQPYKDASALEVRLPSGFAKDKTDTWSVVYEGGIVWQLARMFGVTTLKTDGSGFTQEYVSFLKALGLIDKDIPDHKVTMEDAQVEESQILDFKKIKKMMRSMYYHEDLEKFDQALGTKFSRGSLFDWYIPRHKPNAKSELDRKLKEKIREEERKAKELEKKRKKLIKQQIKTYKNRRKQSIEDEVNRLKNTGRVVDKHIQPKRGETWGKIIREQFSMGWTGTTEKLGVENADVIEEEDDGNYRKYPIDSHDFIMHIRDEYKARNDFLQLIIFEKAYGVDFASSEIEKAWKTQEKNRIEQIKREGVLNPYLSEGRPDNPGIYPIDERGKHIEPQTEWGHFKDYYADYNRYHEGQDWSLVEGTQISSLILGKVVLTGDNGDTTYGKFVVIQNEINPKLFYLAAHLKEIKVQKPDEVVPGTVVGLSGKTGDVGGPHLHLSVIKIESEKLEDFHHINEEDKHVFIRENMVNPFRHSVRW